MPVWNIKFCLVLWLFVCIILRMRVHVVDRACGWQHIVHCCYISWSFNFALMCISQSTQVGHHQKWWWWCPKTPKAYKYVDKSITEKGMIYTRDVCMSLSHGSIKVSFIIQVCLIKVLIACYCCFPTKQKRNNNNNSINNSKKYKLSSIKFIKVWGEPCVCVWNVCTYIKRDIDIYQLCDNYWQNNGITYMTLTRERE